MTTFIFSPLNWRLKVKMTLVFIFLAATLAAREWKFPFFCPGGWTISQSDNSFFSTQVGPGATVTIIKGYWRAGYPFLASGDDRSLIVVASSDPTIVSIQPVTLLNNSQQPVPGYQFNALKAGSCTITTTYPNCAPVYLYITVVNFFYRDFDHDTYGDPNHDTLATSLPAGYAINNTDCDDNDPNVFVSGIVYIDGDGDGYTNGSTTMCHGSLAPTGYSLTSKGTDCDDSDPTVFTSGPVYVDNDGDGYDNGFTVQCHGGAAPTGYSLATNGNDCNDSDPTHHTQTIYFRDLDGDTYGDRNWNVTNDTIIGCAGFIPDGYVSNFFDCDDNNPAVPTFYYPDVDGDGYGYNFNNDPNVNGCYIWTWHPVFGRVEIHIIGNGGPFCPDWPVAPVFSCSPPPGYVANGNDCNDGDAMVHPKTFYKDVDGDTYGISGDSIVLCNSSTIPPNGYGVVNGDCDDAIAAINPATTWYKDTDNDGYSDGATQTQCARPTNYKLSSELTATSGDCNEANPAINPGTVLTITAPAAKTVNADAGTCTASNVSLGTAVWSNNCSVLTVTNNAPSVFPKGQTVVIWTVSDAAGHSATASQTVTVADNQQPVITGAYPDITVLWPPNHKMKEVVINYTATDNCGVTTTLSVSSNEPVAGTGNGDLSPDWEVIDNHHVRLRAEKSKVNDDRIYTITITATDAGGNTAGSAVTVTVPHNNQPVTNNARVETPTTISSIVQGQPMNGALTVRVMPNPTSTNFRFIVTGTQQAEKIKMTVVDMYGRIIEQRILAGEQTITAGNQYRPGVYTVKFTQGEQSERLRLIKLPE
jgi:hypothetical protein